MKVQDFLTQNKEAMGHKFVKQQRRTEKNVKECIISLEPYGVIDYDRNHIMMRRDYNPDHRAICYLMRHGWRVDFQVRNEEPMVGSKTDSYYSEDELLDLPYTDSFHDFIV